MQITTEMIKRLRDKTGAGMMDCKRALESTEGNMDAAVEFLRKKGAAVAQKRSDRSAKEGMIVTSVSQDGKTGIILEVNSETDFVGRSDDFVRFAETVAQTLQQQQSSTLEELLTAATDGGKTVSALMNDLLAKVGEKIEIRRFKIVESDGGLVSSYTHLGSKIGVLVELTGANASDSDVSVGRDIAMQIAAMNPQVISRDQIEQKMIDQELDIYRTQAANEGKPTQVVERIAAGRLEKFFQEVCLIEQTYIKDPGRTVKDFLRETGSVAGTTISVKQFYRFHLGEELSTN
ncbi:MAG: translation elongation factor Ts [Bacteroidota bacterium]